MKQYRVLATAFSALPLLLSPPVAHAQTAAVASDARMDLARQIVDISYPVESREEMFMNVVDQMEAQMLQSLGGQISDDGAMAIVREFQYSVRAEQAALLQKHIPMLMSAWTQAYAELFTEAELRDILAFLKTDTGSTFMMRSAEVLSNAKFAQANQAYMDEATAMIFHEMPRLVEKLVEYKAEQESQ